MFLKEWCDIVNSNTDSCNISILRNKSGIEVEFLYSVLSFLLLNKNITSKNKIIFYLLGVKIVVVDRLSMNALRQSHA